MPARLFEAREKIDKSTLKIIRATIQKRMASILSFAHYISRQLHRSGIHGNIYTSMDILPDGYRLTVEYHIVTLDEEVLRKCRGQLHKSAYDYQGPLRIYRRVERLLSEGKIEEPEEGEIDVRRIEDSGASEGGSGPEKEGGEGEDQHGGADTASPG